MCSTPFGDIDECTRPGLKIGESRVECSTPFGDIDECTQQRLQLAHDPDLVLNRLSATLMNARPQRWSFTARRVCSTPFGDIDECTTYPT